MAGTNILVRQKDLIAGAGISITPDTTSGNVTIAATNTAIDEARLLPTGGRNGNLLEYQEGVDRGNDVNTKLLIQPATSDGQIIDSAYGNEAPVGISQGTSNSPVTVENGESLAFSGSSAYLTIAEEDAAKIITGTNEWCFDVLITPEWSSGSAGVFHLGGGNYSIYINPSTGNSWIWSLSESGTIGLFANETHLLTLEQWLDGSTWKLSWYCDGVPKRTESFQYPVPDKTIRIGRGNDNDGYFQGKMNNIRFRTVANHRGASFAMPPFPFLPPAGQPVWAEGIDRSRLLKVPTSADEGKLPVIRADKIPAVYHDTTLAAIVIEGDKVIDKISGKELTKVGSPQIIDGGIHSPTNSDYYMLELEGVEGLPVAVSFDYQGDESPDSSNIVTINGNCAYYSMNGVSFCRSQGGGNNIKIDDQPVGVSEVYRNYVMQVSSDNYESKTPPVAFIAGESKSPTYEGSFPAMSPLSSVKVCGRFGKIRNILIGSAFPYTGNFTPRGDGVEGFGVPEKQEPGWNYETLDEAANGRLLPANPANGDIPCFDATATIGGGNDETVKFLLQPATTDGELIDSAAGAVTPATITNHSLTVSESGEIEFSSSKYATVPASGILADVLRHDKPWVFDLLVYLDQTSSQSRFFGTESGGDFFCQWTGDYGFDFKYGDTWISTLTGNVGEWNLLTLEYYQKNGTWHVALYLQGVLCQDKEISTSFDPKTSELAIGRSTSGSYLCSGKIRAIRIREGALYNGQSFTPDEFPYQEPQTVGEWGKLNKSELVQSVNGVAPNESGNVILDASTIIDNSRLLPETGSVSSDSVGNPVIFKAISRIDNTYWLCLPLNEDTNDRSTYGVATEIDGTVNVVSNAPSSPGGSAFFNGSSCLHGTLPAQFGSGDFTVRFWMMAPEMNSSTYPQTIFSTRRGDETSGSTFGLLCTTKGRLYVYSNTNITSRTDTPFTLQPNVWYHVAVVRKSGVLTIYVNGEVYNSATFTNSLTRQIFGLGASWTGSSYSEAGTVYLTSLDVLNYAAYDGAFTVPTYQPGTLAGMGYKVATDSEVTDMLSSAGIDETRLLPDNPSDYDLAIYRVFPEEAAPQNLTSATSDPNWEVTWSGAYSGRVGWWAFDSDQGTMWCTYSAAVGDWLCWEYKGTEGSVLLRRYSIAKGSGNGDCPTGWKIQGSNDGSTWVDLDEQTGQSFPDNNAKEYTIPNNSTPYKFHRFYLLSWNTSNMIGTFKAWSWINSTEERKVWIPINKSELMAGALPEPPDAANEYYLHGGSNAVQVSPVQYYGDSDSVWTMSLAGVFYGDPTDLFGDGTQSGASAVIGVTNTDPGYVTWSRKDQVTYAIKRISCVGKMSSPLSEFPSIIGLSYKDTTSSDWEFVHIFQNVSWTATSVTNTETIASVSLDIPSEYLNYPKSYAYQLMLAGGGQEGETFTLVSLAAFDTSIGVTWKDIHTITPIIESKNNPGYFKLPGGTIIEYGNTYLQAGTSNFSIMFPAIFPTALISVTGTVKNASSDDSTTGINAVVSFASGPNPRSELYGSIHFIGTPLDTDLDVHWIAIGY